MKSKSKSDESYMGLILLVSVFVLAATLGVILVASSEPSSREYFIGIGTLVVTILLASVNTIYAYLMRRILISENDYSLSSACHNIL